MRAAALVAAILLLTPTTVQASRATSHFTGCTARTGQTATVIVPGEAPPMLGDQQMQPGDELAVFTPEGVCAGAAVWEGTALAIAVWEDDPFIEGVVGFVSGSPLSFRAYQAATGRTFGAEAQSVSIAYREPHVTDGVFAPNAIFVIDQLNFETGLSADESAGVYPFALAAAYPNPFAQATTLAYSLPAEAKVSLVIFDLLGRRVATLVDESQPAGRHEVRFEPPAGLAAGMLLVRLVAGGESAAVRLTYVR